VDPVPDPLLFCKSIQAISAQVSMSAGTIYSILHKDLTETNITIYYVA
jgi:hypothetical protein